LSSLTDIALRAAMRDSTVWSRLGSLPGNAGVNRPGFTGE
jgi:hypothetical protein